MSRSRQHHRDDRGVVAIELALAMTCLLMIIIASVVVGNFLRIKTQTAGLARDGARAAALHQPLPTGTEVIGAACPTPNDPTKFVTVTATASVTLRKVPLMPVTFIPATTTETVTMRCAG